jgi:hypothetical protein
MAQAPQAAAGRLQKMPDRTYMAKNSFKLPVIIDDGVRASLREIQLWVKESPTSPWRMADKASASATSFNYRLAQDGEYWFNVVTVDQQGRTTPADVTREMPEVIIVLDTQGPQVDLHLLACTELSNEGLVVHCDVQDANPNPFQTRLEYQTGDHVWRAAEVLPNQPECFLIPKQAVLTGMVKVTASDRALNSTIREFNLATVTAASPPLPGEGPNHSGLKVANFEDKDTPQVIKSGYLPLPATEVGEGAVKAAPAPPLSKEPRIHTTDVMSLPMEAPAAVQSAAAPAGPRLPEIPHKVEMPTLDTVPHVSGSDKVTCKAECHGKYHLVSNPEVTLAYKIEDENHGGVGKVEVWYTRNGGQNWEVLCDDPDCKSPVQFKLPGEGVYGIRLTVSNARGFGAEAPKPGDAPELVVELDTTKPTAQLKSVVLVPPSVERASCIDIEWTAADKNLGAEPVELYYSVNAAGPWTPIAKGLHNEGKYRWFLPQGMGKQAYVRLVAVDQASNSCRCEIAEPIALDDGKRPTVSIVDVVPASQGMNPTGN